jgi:hypothetical protein
MGNLVNWLVLASLFLLVLGVGGVGNAFMDLPKTSSAEGSAAIVTESVVVGPAFP